MKTKAIEKLLETLKGCREFMRIESEVIEDKHDRNTMVLQDACNTVHTFTIRENKKTKADLIREEAEEKASRLERYYKNKDLIEEGIKFLSSQVEYSKENKDE